MSSQDLLDSLSAPQRQIACTLDAPLFVEAGAGSGKTFTLTRRIVYALTPGSAQSGTAFLNGLDEVLVITFTEAAAREIRERVRTALREAGMYEAALQVDSAWISTIHGMCSRILHRHALDLGLDPDFSNCPTTLANTLLSQAANDVIAAARKDRSYRELFEAYDAKGAQAFTSSPGGVEGLLRAVRAAAARCPHGFRDLQVLNVSGPDSVRKSMAKLSEEFDFLASYHLSAAGTRAVCASREALQGFCSLAVKEQDSKAAFRVLDNIGLPRSTKEIADVLADLKQNLALTKLEIALADAASRAPQALGLAQQMDERYAELKRSHSVLDNDDLIHLTLVALRKHSELARIYASRFRLVMVDEFQDTDETQLELIKLLVGGDESRLCTVGDAQQSIYGFRGADVAVFRGQGRRLPDEAHVRLTTNFRSHSDVLAFVERICGAKAKQEGSNLEPHDGVLKDYMHLDASTTRKDGYVANGLPRIFVEALTGKSNGKYPNKCQRSLMAYSIADRLYSYAEKGEPLSDMALLLGVTTHADLYIDAIRARGMQCVVTGGSTFTSTPEVKVVCALLHTLANFSDTASGLFPLLASEMFGLDADDFCLLGTRSQEKLDAPTKRSIERGLIDMEFYGGHRPSVRLVRAHDVLMHARKEIALRPIADVCLEVIRSSGWLARLEAEGATGLARAANVLAAVRYIRDLTSDLGLGAARAAVEFDQWLGLAKIPPASLAGGADQAIKIMTIHASKGLEFPVVAVAECWNNPEPERDVLTVKLPSFQGQKKAKDDANYLMLGSKAVSDALKKVKDFDPESLGSTEGGDQSLIFSKIFFSGNLAQMKQEQAEKARLLYVALTRAREALIVGINCASGANGISSQLASGVIGALGADLVAGLQLLDYGGSERCTVRTTEVRHEDKKQGGAQTLCVDSANTLGSFDGSYTDPDPSEFLGLSAEHPDTLGFAVPESGQHTSFDLKGYRAREDVFSYSSAHALLERQAARSAKPSAALYQDIAAQTAETPDNRDVDKATNLGSAFHELAQIMVESGQIPDARRIEASAAYWHLSSRATSRLRKALLCWEGSDIRKEALSHELVFAEQPFFTAAPFGTERFGSYIEGAIDLLCYDRNPDGSLAPDALVIDYKTGDLSLSPSEISARHEMQARLYASVLFEQGFKQVSCRFVCVELDAGEVRGATSSGQPYIASYDFEGAVEPL